MVVDIGANIGLASLFFLTRRPDTVVHAAEPVPRNGERLRANLADFAERVHLDTRAVAPAGGRAQFFVEDSGRLGGLREFVPHDRGENITVDCVAMGDYLEQVLDAEGRIDLVKIDTEGSERALVAAIPAHLRQYIAHIVWESDGQGTTLWI